MAQLAARFTGELDRQDWVVIEPLADKPLHLDEPNELAAYRKVAEDENSSEQDRERAKKIIAVAGSYSFAEKAPSLEDVIGKIELASGYRS